MTYLSRCRHCELLLVAELYKYMKMNFDLAQKDMMCCSPEPISKSDRMSYPSFHYSGDKELDLPDSGLMTIRFRKSGSSENTNSNGKESYSCTVDVQEIVSVEDSGGAKKSAARESDDALDALVRARAEEKED
jgi:hypothetical protein